MAQVLLGGLLWFGLNLVLDVRKQEAPLWDVEVKGRCCRESISICAGDACAEADGRFVSVSGRIA